jgi:short-subunit dehydrogenase
MKPGGSNTRTRALVTGASSGIGAAFAERLARDQYDLVLVARDRARLDELAAKISRDHGVEVEVLPADLTRSSQLCVVENRVAGDPGLDVLINNAGFGTSGAFVRLEPDREEEEIRLNVIALVRLTRAALPGMIARRGGAIINVSSMAAFQPGPFNATYCATKAYVNSFTEALHEELRGTGVKLQALCPGFTRTEFQKRAGIDTSGLPEFVWMSPESVVDASLAGLGRDIVLVPGYANRAVAAMATAMPRSVTRRLVGGMMRKRLDEDERG